MEKLIQSINGVFLFSDPVTGLTGCIALDHCKNGHKVAIGGTRFSTYSSTEEAIKDAVRLAKSMTKKCQMARIPFTGAKAVILKPALLKDHRAFLEKYGMIVNSLKGGFITGCDVGLTNFDMSIVNKVSPYVTGLSQGDFDYLSHLTAFGVLQSIKMAVSRLCNTSSMKNLRLLISGVGKVGESLAKMIHSEGAHLIISDIDLSKMQNLSSLLGCKTVSPRNILSTKCDVLVPCALGNVIHSKNVAQLKCKLICGAANNQIHDNSVYSHLDKMNITFIPDWISNIGGTIYAALSYQKKPVPVIESYLENVIKLRVNEFLKLASTLELSEAVKIMSNNST